jgi:hypothetical protein
MPPDVNNCCVYEMKIERGIPYIDKSENEILLPRNLKITYTGDYISSNPKRHIRKLTVSKSTDGQFENINKKQCTQFYQANISAVEVVFMNDEGKNEPIKRKRSAIITKRKRSATPVVDITKRRRTATPVAVKKTRKSVKILSKLQHFLF